MARAVSFPRPMPALDNPHGRLTNLSPVFGAFCMAKKLVSEATAVWPVVALIVVQSLCTVIFIGDVASDIVPQGFAGLIKPASLSELAASTGLLLGLVFEGIVLWLLLGRHQRMAQSLSVASGALSDLMAGYFRTWALTPTEADVAAFTIKGYSIAEIAALRGSAEGTIKTHLNAIYRKSGTGGRAQLVSVLVEDLFAGVLIGPAGAVKL